MSAEIDREQIIFTITLTTNYSETYLESLSDEKLLRTYERIMNKEMKQNGIHY